MINDRYQSKNITASSAFQIGEQCVTGAIFCSSGTAPTCAIFEGKDNTGVKKVDTFIMTAGTNYTFNIFMKNGFYVELGGTSPSVTVMWDA